MKVNFKIASFLGVLLCTLCLSVNSYAGWDYKSSTDIDRMEGRTYFVTHCTSFIGDDCTTPNSSSRIDISILVDALSLFGIVKKI